MDDMRPAAPLPPADAPSWDLIHGRARLRVICHLVRHGPTSFTELRAAAGATDGALSVHLAKLHDAGLIAIEKGYEGKRPRTIARLTEEGARQFAAYVEDLRRLVPGLSA